MEFKRKVIFHTIEFRKINKQLDFIIMLITKLSFLEWCHQIADWMKQMNFNFNFWSGSQGQLGHISGSGSSVFEDLVNGVQTLNI